MSQSKKKYVCNDCNIEWYAPVDKCPECDKTVVSQSDKARDVQTVEDVRHRIKRLKESSTTNDEYWNFKIGDMDCDFMLKQYQAQQETISKLQEEIEESKAKLEFRLNCIKDLESKLNACEAREKEYFDALNLIYTDLTLNGVDCLRIATKVIDKHGVK